MIALRTAAKTAAASALFCGFLAGAPQAHASKTGDTLLGAGIGALGGALLTDGDIWGTLGGAVAGGVVGHVVSGDGKDKKHHYKNHRKYKKHKHRDDRRHRSRWVDPDRRR